jgi:DMSO/TMAO reductase YedYZ molybdopterin-dependent catalytic subunit
MEEPFVCEEGWQTPALTWEGVRLLDVLELGEPRSGAGWVRVCAGDYAVPLAVNDAAAAVLAERLNGELLGLDHGGPWRLVIPGASCFTSVKWVDRLQLAAEPGDASGERIARGRLERNG